MNLSWLFTRQSAAYAGLSLLMLTAATGASAQSALVKPAPAALTSAVDQVPPGPGVIRSRTVVTQPKVVADLATTAPGNKIVLDLFDDTRFLVSLKDKFETPEPNSYSWSGQVQGHPLATFNMSVVGEATVVDVRIPGGTSYSIRYRGHGVHEVQEISEDAQGTCGTTGTLPHQKPLQKSPSAKALGLTPESDTANEVDVLVMYTHDAEIQAGGFAGMQALINQAVTFANTSYVNSGVPLILVKVAAIKTFYTPDAGDMGVDLTRLQDTDDGYMDEVHAIRNAYKADMVCLMRGTTAGGNCGIAYLMTSGAISNAFAPLSFAVCANSCVTNQTFAHELGHNMGCHHDVGNSGGGQGAYTYSYGWRWNGVPSGIQSRSVMAYAPGNRIQYFSNPAVNFDGAPTGNASANNAQTIINTALTVANFRTRASADGPTLVASGNPITINVPVGTDATYTAYFGNAGTGSVAYVLTENAPWATLSPLVGTATGTGASQPHTFTLDTDSLSLGTYNANVTMTAVGPSNSPLTVPVKLVIYLPPPNDHFVDATDITGHIGSIAGFNINATRQTGEPATIAGYAGSHSIWYKWVAPAAGPAQFDTIGSSFDTLLGVYTGSLGTLTQIAANDEGSGIAPRSRVNFTAVAGTTYYILIDGYNGETGTTSVQWTAVADVNNWSQY